MIERFLSVATGALVTFLMLIVLNPTDSLDPNSDYITAVLVGAVVSLIWPLVWLFFARRRRQKNMDEKVAEEVAKQIGS